MKCIFIGPAVRNLDYLDSYAGAHVGGVSSLLQQGCHLMVHHIDMMQQSRIAKQRKRLIARWSWGGRQPMNYNSRDKRRVGGSPVLLLQFHPKAFALHPTTLSVLRCPPRGQ